MPDRVNKATRDHIRQVAKELGYSANLTARNLKLGRGNIIAVVVQGPLFSGASHVYAELLRNVDEVLTPRGYGMMVANNDGKQMAQERLLQLVNGNLISGAIVLSSPMPTFGTRSLNAIVPTISLMYDRSAEGVPSVITDDRKAMYRAATHLVRQGHRRLFYVGGPDGNYHQVQRWAGVVDCLEENEIDPSTVLQSRGRFDFNAGLKAAQIFLASSDRPTGVLCCSDDIAIAFMSSVRSAGVRVPQDVSVIGFDGAAVGEYTEPGLTTMRQPTTALGRRAAKLLLDMIAGEIDGPSRMVFETELIRRSSTANGPDFVAP
jgi:LacI family repressor for deo operon, udp, cdd, tsx, nupC, and nupG